MMGYVSLEIFSVTARADNVQYWNTKNLPTGGARNWRLMRTQRRAGATSVATGRCVLILDERLHSSFAKDEESRNSEQTPQVEKYQVDRDRSKDWQICAAITEGGSQQTKNDLFDMELLSRKEAAINRIPYRRRNVGDSPLDVAGECRLDIVGGCCSEDDCLGTKPLSTMRRGRRDI
jgi:hypothetical protein